MINPKQIVMNFLVTNPKQKAMLNRLMNMSESDLYQFATNYCNERGIDLPKSLEEIKKTIW